MSHCMPSFSSLRSAQFTSLCDNQHSSMFVCAICEPMSPSERTIGSIKATSTLGSDAMLSLTRILASGVLLVSMTAVAWTQDIGAQADAYLTAWANQGRFSGVVLIAKGDKVLLRKGY